MEDQKVQSHGRPEGQVSFKTRRASLMEDKKVFSINNQKVFSNKGFLQRRPEVLFHRSSSHRRPEYLFIEDLKAFSIENQAAFSIDDHKVFSRGARRFSL